MHSLPRHGTMIYNQITTPYSTSVYDDVRIIVYHLTTTTLHFGCKAHQSNC